MTKENKEEFFSQMTDRLDIVYFVKEVEKYPCIYNHTLPEYSNRAVTTRAWSEIAKKLDSNVNECRDKWRKIRIAFMRSLKQAARGCPPMRPYYLSDYLSFVLPFMKLDTINQQSPTAEEDDEVESMETKQEVHSDYEENDTSNYNGHRIFITTQSDPIEAKADRERKWKTSDYIDKSDQVSDAKGKRKSSDVLDKISDPFGDAKSKRRSTDYIMEKINECNEGFLPKRKCSDNIEDNPRKMFLLSLMPDIESMTEQEMRVFRRNVISTIDDIMSARQSNQ